MHIGFASIVQFWHVTLQAMSKMVEALQRDMEEEVEARQAEGEMRGTAQQRCAAAEEHATKLEWEYNEAAAALQRKASSFSRGFPCFPMLVPVSLCAQCIQMRFETQHALSKCHAECTLASTTAPCTTYC